MRDRSTLGAAGLVVAALALASLAAQPRPSMPPSARVGAARHAPKAAVVPPRAVPTDESGATARAEHLEVLRDGGRVDLNRATAGDLELLPGIGPTLARRIVEDRTRAGAYRAVEDLVRVAGIGPAKLDRIRALVDVGARDPDDGGDAQRSNRNTPETSAAK